MPAAASSASFSWRCVVDGGWTIIVWMLPSDAVSAGIVSASTNARAAGRPPSSSKANIPLPPWNWRATMSAAGWLGSSGWRTWRTPS